MDEDTMPWEASQLASLAFPYGACIVDTPSTNLECALHAMIGSYGHQLHGYSTNVEPPTIEELRSIVRSEEYAQRVAVGPGMANTNDFTLDQAALILNIWGRQDGRDIIFNIGAVMLSPEPEEVPQFLLVSADVPTPHTIWIHNDMNGEGNPSLYSHWSSLQPRQAPVPQGAENQGNSPSDQHGTENAPNKAHEGDLITNGKPPVDQQDTFNVSPESEWAEDEIVPIVDISAFCRMPVSGKLFWKVITGEGDDADGEDNDGWYADDDTRHCTHLKALCVLRLAVRMWQEKAKGGSNDA